MFHASRWSPVIAIVACSALVAAEHDARPNADSPANAAHPYVQTTAIAMPSGQGAILGFCVPAGGGIVAVTGPNERYGAGPRRTDAKQPPPRRVVWFDADGAEARAVELDFAATVVCEAADGGIYVAGDGVLARLSPEGTEVSRVPTPGGPKTDEEQAELEALVAERHEAQLAASEEQIRQMQDVVAKAKEHVKQAEDAAAEADEADDEDGGDQLRAFRARQVTTLRTQAIQAAQLLRKVEAAAARWRRQDPRELVDQAIRNARRVCAISATRDAVFVVAAEISGYQYALWRLDDRLENPEKIMADLVGCCGQMDVQVIGGRLAVAANRKHCVDVADFTGETVAQVGAKNGGRAGAAGFGGCCNPMNVCPGPGGSLLTSESDGVVKRFDADGTFVEIVGKAKVRAGCKNSAIAIEPDGSKLYYLDSAGGKVLVLTRPQDRGPDESNGDSPALTDAATSGGVAQ